MIIVWGVAHIFPTRNVVFSFGDISRANRRIITMTWVSEGITLVFPGVLVILVTLLGGRENPVSGIVYYSGAAMLAVTAVWTGLIGARTPAVPMKIRPFVKAVAFLLGVLV